MDYGTSKPTSHEVDDYMRHVGRTLYEIIHDWLQEQKAIKAGLEHKTVLKEETAEEGGSI